LNFEDYDIGSWV
jgi:hypothetical protein